jgi:hypothetical protein
VIHSNGRELSDAMYVVKQCGIHNTVQADKLVQVKEQGQMTGFVMSDKKQRPSPVETRAARREAQPDRILEWEGGGNTRGSHDHAGRQASVEVRSNSSYLGPSWASIIPCDWAWRPGKRLAAAPGPLALRQISVRAMAYLHLRANHGGAHLLLGAMGGIRYGRCDRGGSTNGSSEGSDGQPLGMG